jgi:hypothetical protein
MTFSMISSSKSEFFTLRQAGILFAMIESRRRPRLRRGIEDFSLKSLRIWGKQIPRSPSVTT